MVKGCERPIFHTLNGSVPFTICTILAQPLGHFRQIVFDPRASFSLAGGPLSSPRPWPSYEDLAKETGIWTHDVP